MASNETREDGSTATQRLRAMESARPSMTFQNSGPSRFAQRFMKEIPGAIESARATAAVARGALADPGSGAGVPVSPGPASSASQAPAAVSISGLRDQYEQLKTRPHTLTVAEVEELQQILTGEAEGEEA